VDANCVKTREALIAQQPTAPVCGAPPAVAPTLGCRCGTAFCATERQTCDATTSICSNAAAPAAAAAVVGAVPAAAGGPKFASYR